MEKKRAGRSYLFEILVSGILLAVMVFVRFSYIHGYMTELQGDTSLLELSMIRNGDPLPYFSNTLGGIYAGGLRIVFWLAGNKEQAIFYVQAAVQALTLLFFYLSYRKACGFVFAVLSLLAVMFADSGLMLIGEVTPGNLLLLFTGIYLLFFAFALRQGERKTGSRFSFEFGFFCTGVLCGLLAALDSLGLALAVVSCLLIICLKKIPVGFVMGTAAGAAAAFFAKSCYYGLAFLYPCEEYYSQFLISEDWNPVHRFGVSSSAAGIFILLFALGAAGRILLKLNREENQLFINLCDILNVQKAAALQETAGTQEETGQQKETAPWENTGSQENTVSQENANSQTGSQVHYIENPLPVPKKHVRREMTYAFEPSEAQMRFDIEDLPEGMDYDVN